jgi:hypothetical protein
MVRDLIKELEDFDEPTVVFMYGDHLPSLSLKDTDLRTINLYQTEWILWDNIGLKVEHKDITAYQASTYIFNRLKLDGGLMQHFHNEYMDSADYEDYLNKLEMLEYDTLYGEDYAFDGVNPFPKTNMTMGLRDIVVEGYEDGIKYISIKGKGFNEFSIVNVDGKEVDTKYYNYQTLMIPAGSLDDAKEITVSQVGDDHIVLSTSKPYKIERESTEETTENDSVPAENEAQ